MTPDILGDMLVIHGFRGTVAAALNWNMLVHHGFCGMLTVAALP